MGDLPDSPLMAWGVAAGALLLVGAGLTEDSHWLTACSSTAACPASVLRKSLKLPALCSYSRDGGEAATADASGLPRDAGASPLLPDGCGLAVLAAVWGPGPAPARALPPVGGFDGPSERACTLVEPTEGLALGCGRP